MPYIPRCPRCGSRATVNMTAHNAASQTAKDFLLGAGIGATLGYLGMGEYAADAAGAVSQLRSSGSSIQFECTNCGFKWFFSGKEPAVQEYRIMVVPEGSKSRLISGHQSLTSFSDYSSWLGRMQRKTTDSISEAIGALLLLVKYAQGMQVGDTTVDSLLDSLNKALGLSHDEKEKSMLRDFYAQMIACYVQIMEAKYRMVITYNRQEARPLFTKGGEMLSECVKLVTLMSGCLSQEAMSKIEISNIFAPDNETSSIHSLIGYFASLNGSDDSVEEVEDSFFGSLDNIFLKLGDNSHALLESAVLSSMINKYTPELELYLGDSIVGRREAYLKVKDILKYRKRFTIVMSIVAVIAGLIVYFAYLINDEASVWAWFFLITGGVFGLGFFLYKLGIDNKQKPINLRLEQIRDHIYKIKEIGRKLSPRSNSASKVEYAPAFSPVAELLEENIVDSPDADFSPADTSESEKQYLDFYKEMIADGVLSERELKMLDTYREKCGISKERAKELEGYAYYPEITDEEQEYLDMYCDYAADGEISERDRKMLDKMLEKMGIDRERAEMLENSVKLPDSK